jgi:hypothetical protein
MAMRWKRSITTRWLSAALISAALGLSMSFAVRAQDLGISPTAAMPEAVVTVPGFYEEVVTVSCGTVVSCLVHFRKVPEGKHLVVTRASCFIRVHGTQLLNTVYLNAKNAKDVILERFHFLIPVQLNATSGGKSYQINDETLQLYRQNETPFILAGVQQNATIGMTCQIAGTLKNN